MSRSVASASHCLRLIVAFALALVGASAQDQFPLREVEFVGGSTFSSESLLAVSGLEIGQPVSKRDFDTALRHINDTSLFEGMRYSFEPLAGGYKLTITLQEITELFPVRLDGFGDAASDLESRLRAKLPLYEAVVPATGPAVRTLVNIAASWWREQGGEETVVADLVPVGQAGFEMIVGPERETFNIAFTTFDNTGAVDSRELQRTFNHAAVGEAYTEARLKELLHYNARPSYTELGYMNVQFCPCTTAPDPESAGLLVKVHVEQGEVYTFGAINWPDPLPIDEESLARSTLIGVGQRVDLKAAYETMAAISEGMKRQGYMKAQATFDEHIDHEAKKVSLDVEISPGRQYFFSRLVIDGLDILSEPFVRKRWGMQSGAPFDIRYPAYFLDRVKADAMFENLKRTSWSIDEDDNTGLVDITLHFSGLAKEPIPDQPNKLTTPF